MCSYLYNMQLARLDYMLDEDTRRAAPPVSRRAALAAWRASVEREVAAMRVPGIERLAGVQWWSHGYL